MIHNSVRGGGGAAINLVSAGPSDGPQILAIHGIGQSRLAWAPLLSAAEARGWRVTALDLRGHGDSDKPLDAYADPQLWADDIHQALGQLGASAERPATAIAWSYGGAVITDYLAAYGGQRLGSLVLAGATDKLGAPVIDYVQPKFGALTKAIMTDDSGQAAADLLALCDGDSLEPAYRAALLEEALKCPAYVRNAMLRRTVDNDDALAAFTGPVVVIHGTDDHMFTLALGEHLAEVAPHGELRVYDGAGHLPLWHDESRFLDDIASVVDI